LISSNLLSILVPKADLSRITRSPRRREAERGGDINA
jgi:hypothetical protein